jgi:single-stranded-DNA-specific exonuclease
MSLETRKRWQVCPRASEAHFARFPDLTPLVVQILSNRGITEPDQVRDFLACRPSHDTNPFLLKGMPEAVARLWQAIDAGELIAIDRFGGEDTSLYPQPLR